MISKLHWRPWLVEQGYTEEEVARLVWQQKDLSKAIARKYELEGLLLVNSCFHVTYAEWIRMPRSLRRGFVELAEEYNRNIENSRREREQSLQKQIEGVNSVRLPHPAPSALPKLMGT